MRIEDLYTTFLEHPTVSTDSRNCPPGSLFFALKGENFNANAFAASALENGAAFAVIDEPEFAVDSRYIVVENVLLTLQDLARYHRKVLGTKIIGITGTNGKTTTKELIASVLTQKYEVLYTKGNLNNHIGVPLTLLQLSKTNDIAVIEMGANHPGEIKMLSEIACPDYGIITNVGKAHLEGFGSFDGVKKTKAELYQYIFSNGKDVFINTDNEHLCEMVKTAGFGNNDRLIPFSLSGNSGYLNGEVLSCSPFLKLKCGLKNKEPFEISTNLIGIYNAENVMAAVAIGHFFDVPVSDIQKGLESYTPQNNRSQLTLTSKNKLVVDAYNANPTSMKAAILNFSQMEVEGKMLILGDMLELGEQTASEHQAIVDLLSDSGLTDVKLVGANFLNTQNNFSCFGNVDDLIASLSEILIENKYILIKGSRGIKLEKVIQYL